MRDKRSEEELTKLMKEWSLAKSRIQKEIIHKIDRKSYGNQFKDCQFKQNIFSKKEQDEIKLGIIQETINEEEMAKINEKKEKQMEQFRQDEDFKKR